MSHNFAKVNSSGPFYVWANDDCANKSDCFEQAKEIRSELINEGGENVYIVDADGVEVVDAEIEAHEASSNADRLDRAQGSYPQGNECVTIDS